MLQRYVKHTTVVVSLCRLTVGGAVTDRMTSSFHSNWNQKESVWGAFHSRTAALGMILAQVRVFTFTRCVFRSLACTQIWVRSFRVCWMSSGRVLLPWCPLAPLAFRSESHLTVTDACLSVLSHPTERSGVLQNVCSCVLLGNKKADP